MIFPGALARFADDDECCWNVFEEEGSSPSAISGNTFINGWDGVFGLMLVIYVGHEYAIESARKVMVLYDGRLGWVWDQWLEEC